MVYQWRWHGHRVEIRPPGKLNLKWLIPTWQFQGLPSLIAWEELHGDCCHEGCCDPCTAFTVTPGMVRQYIDEMRKVTCNEV